MTSDSLSVPMTGGISDSQLLLSLCGVALVGVLVFFVVSYRQRMLKWKDRSQHWFSVAMGEKPMIDTGNAKRMMNDLFPGGRIVKATPVNAKEIFRPLGAPSTESDVARSREWREHRALRGLDHHRRHSVDAKCDSEAATEILMFTVGGGEKDV